MTYSIVAEGLAKRYGDTVALDGVDLAVRTGSVFGLLGPNGAGKTTAVRILATLVRPDGANSASQTPPGMPGSSDRAASTASRVLPAPPGPVSVIRRWAPTSFRTSVISVSRPTKLVSSARRLVPWGSGAGMADGAGVAVGGPAGEGAAVPGGGSAGPAGAAVPGPGHIPSGRRWAGRTPAVRASAG
jgi:energy-coupling factor transporter ATP-binding protein EcfA2